MTDFYSRAAANNPAPSLEAGASGYFSPPSDTLDPHLFDGETIKNEVSAWLWGTLHGALDRYHLNRAAYFTHAWLAGSGITYQWSADRGNGDLDVLFGVDYAKLLRYNPQYKGLSEAQFAAELDDWLRTNVWPSTSAVDFNGQTYEVTFFLNPGTGTDIHNIHPYAALDLRSGEWIVRPPHVSQDPMDMYSSTWFHSAQRDVTATHALAHRYSALVTEASRGTAASRVNTEARIREVVGQAQSLFNEIHGGRREAFGAQGTGYGDYHNFRWQYGKRSGAVKVLSDLSQVGKQAHEAEEADLYGGPILGANEALARAALVNRIRKDR